VIMPTPPCHPQNASTARLIISTTAIISFARATARHGKCSPRVECILRRLLLRLRRPGAWGRHEKDAFGLKSNDLSPSPCYGFLYEPSRRAGSPFAPRESGKAFRQRQGQHRRRSVCSAHPSGFPSGRVPGDTRRKSRFRQPRRHLGGSRTSAPVCGWKGQHLRS
jgi:hypothetical protein